MEFSDVDVVADVGNRRFSSHLQNGTEFVDVSVVVFSVVVVMGARRHEQGGGGTCPPLENSI